MDWFRFHDDVIDNPKLRKLPPEAFRFWTLLLCIANRQTERGALPDQDEIAFRARYGTDETAAFLETLSSMGLVEVHRGKRRIAKWDHFQKPSDSGAARQKRYRDRNKLKGALPPEIPPDDSALRNAERYEERNVLRDARYAKREREIERKESSSPPETQTNQLASPPADEPFHAPLTLVSQPFEPMGPNAASEVEAVYRECQTLGLDGELGIYLPQWLASQPAQRLRYLMARSVEFGAGKPRAFIQKILREPDRGEWQTSQSAAPRKPPVDPHGEILNKPRPRPSDNGSKAS